MNTKILQNHYVLAVHDMRVSANFYIDVMGFEEVAQHDGWIFVQRDNCMIMLGECPDDMPAGDIGSHNYFAYLCVDDAEAYSRQLQAKQAEFLSTIEDKPWGMREFGIRTVDGHRILIGQELGAV
jgi:catechol 2,3-dioxygenase-like lactoylglutathione lyase family enzyme